ncbi:phage tail protein [Sphingomonas psychrotolerans]|uniref:Phage tail protein n=1 Tax=Sphingomonas psychrotolerans TaxID=1327635 RepID=A0ABU3N193_9SPHN|nr:phage tail protein [Sphingomonas psychrotolerans]MDT8758253.1 phage tail protein [Sphingomonas psychrotolerans]
MASAPPSPAQLLTLGMFIFGTDTMAYSDFERQTSWRHATSERFGARPASQFTGPGDDQVRLEGLLVPEIAGIYGSIDRLVEMAGTGDNWPLVDGAGRVLGHFRITSLDQRHRVVMAGGIPRAVEFSLTLDRAD